MKNNPFQEAKEQELSQSEMKQKAIQSAQATMEKARGCINTKQFKEYKEQYENTRKATFDLCQELKSADPITYAFEMSNYMATLRLLGALLNKVETEARTNEQ